MTRYVLPNGKAFRVPDDKLEKFLQEYPDAVKQEANQVNTANTDNRIVSEKVTRFFNEEGKSIRVRDKDIDKFRKENPGYMTKEEIEKQIADYKAAKKEYEQKRKELEAKREEEKRIYEDRIRKGFIKHKGQENTPWYNKTEEAIKTAGEEYITQNNLSIEDMEKYLNDNNFDYIIKGGKQDKGPGFGDFYEAKLGGMVNVVDKFLGGHIGSFQELKGEYLAGQGRVLIDNAREREIAEYAPDEYNKLRAQNYIKIKELEKKQALLEENSEEYNQLQEQIDQAKAEMPSEFKIYKQIEVEDAFDAYDNLVGANFQIGSDGEGRGLFGGKNQKLLNEDGTFKDFDDAFTKEELGKYSQTDIDMFRALHAVNKDMHELDNIVDQFKSRTGLIDTDRGSVLEKLFAENGDKINELAEKYDFEVDDFKRGIEAGAMGMFNGDTSSLFKDARAKISQDYDTAMEEKGFIRDNWMDDEYVKIIFDQEGYRPTDEEIEFVQGEKLAVDFNPAAIAQYKQYLKPYENELQSLIKKVRTVNTTTGSEEDILADDVRVAEGEAKVQAVIDNAYMDAIGQDPQIRYIMSGLVDKAKPELDALQKEYQGLISEATSQEEIVKLNIELENKQNELVIGNLVQDPEYKKRATEIGMAFGEIGKEYNIDFTRQQSGFTRFMDNIYDRKDFDWYNPLEWAAETVNAVGAGVEGITSAIGDQAVASFSGFMVRNRDKKIKDLEEKIKSGAIEPTENVYWDEGSQEWKPDELNYFETQLGFSSEAVSGGSDARSQLENLKEKKTYWVDSIEKQMAEMARSSKRLEAYGGADYSDGISLKDIFQTVGQTLPHIGLAAAGTMAAPFTSGTSLAPVATVLGYAGTVAMGLQMYGDNYNSALEEYITLNGKGRDSIRARIQEENPDLNEQEITTLVENEFKDNMVQAYISGDGANIATSAAIAAAQTALEKFGAEQLVGSFQKAAGLQTVINNSPMKGLTASNIWQATWDDVGRGLYAYALDRGGNAVSEFGTEYMQEVLGMMATGIQTGEGAGAYVKYDQALQSGIGGAISGFAIPFAGDIKTQSTMALRDAASNIALKYSSNSKYALKAKIANEYFEKSKLELNEALASNAITADKHRQQMMTLSNVVNSAKALNLFGDKPGVGSNTMTRQDKFDLMNLQMDIGQLDQEIEMASNNTPLQNALKQEKRTLETRATEIIMADRNAQRQAKRIEAERKRRDNRGRLFSGVPVINPFSAFGKKQEDMSAEELVADYELDKKQNDDYSKLQRLRVKQEAGEIDSTTQEGFNQITDAGAGIIENAFQRLYQKSSLATPQQFRQELKNEFVKVFDSYNQAKDPNNLGIGKQTSNLFNLRANAVATRNIRQQGDTISMSDEKAPQIGDTTEQTDFDADQLQEVGKREKKYMADNTKVTEAVGEEAASEIDRETSQEILREANKGEGAEGIAGALARAFGQATNRGGRGLFNIIGKKVGTLNKGFKDFVDNTVDRDFIAALPAAYLKQSRELQRILGIKNIGDTQVVKTDKDGKKTYSRPSVFAIPSDITDEQVQQVRDYFKKSTTTREGLLKRLSQEFALNSISKLKQDKDFMKKLQTALGDKQNALDFLNEIQGKLDQRTLEDTTKDITVPSKTMDQIIKLLDKGIKIFEAKPGQMRMEIIPGGGNAVAFILRGIKAGLQQGLSFVQALKRVVKQIKDYNAVTKEQKQIIDDQIGSLTEADLDNYEKVQQIVDTALAEVALDKYKNVAESEIEDIKKILKGKNKANKVKALKNFFQFVNTSFQKNSKTHKLWQGDNAEVAFNYWQKEFGVDLGKLGFTLSDGKNKSILLDGKKVVDAGPLRPSNAPTNIQKAYTKKGFKGALEYIRNNIAKADQNSDDAINFIVDTIGDLVEAGKVDVAVQLLDTMGYASDSALRMVGKIRSIQDNVKTVDGKKSVEFEHTPPISVLRDKIRGVLKSNLKVDSIKQQVRDILNESYVDIIGKQEAKKLNDTKEKGGLGRKTTGENLSRYDGAINQKNLVMVERGPEALVKEQKQTTEDNADLAPQIINKKDTTKKVKQTFLQSLKARVKALNPFKDRKGLSAFDLDDTLALTKEKVLYTLPDGKKGELTAGEFAVQYEGLLEQGAEFDYSNFDNVDLSTSKGPLAGTALRRQGKYGPKDIFVVTARPNAAQGAIKVFLDNIGLNIPIENIITLEDGSPIAKADWFISKAAEGYNDFYFADDSALNVQQVKDVLSQLDVKSRVQQAIVDKATRLDQEMNDILEDKTGIKADEEISDVRAKLEGKKKDRGFFKRLMKQLTITASADDFLGLVQYIVGKGETGTRQQKWIRDNLIVPYNKAEQALISAKINVAKDFNALKQAFPTLRNKKGLKGMFSNPLNDDIGVGPYNKSQAVRVYLWNKQGMEIPGMSQADIDALVEAVSTDYELKQFADNIQLIQKEQQYPAPTAYWIAGDIKSDILGSLDKAFRKELLTEWKENVDIIFSPKNMNKLEAAFGSKYVEALRDSLRRMETGTNRPTYQGSFSRGVNEMMDWLNGSVAVAMFLNVRSGTLQMLSNVNFINWGDNNIYAAAKAFLSKDYVPTVMELMNSDYLVNRRDGLKINVNEAELAAAAKKGGFKGMLSYLLDKGFVLTRIFDSLAIATGGATFYMNRQKSLLNRINEKTGKKYTKAEAKQKAFDDFYDIAEETQQSSNPSKISSQQASLFGRLILSFQNVTMQYNRKAKKMLLDLVNRRRRPGMTQRESDLSNLSGVIYYVGVQNLVFNSLQQALFAVAFEDEEEKDRNKTADTINGMVDSILFGLGFGGAIISTVKNVIRELDYQAGLKTPEYEEALFNLFDISPVIDQKVRNIRNGLRTFSWNMADIKKRGWSLDNPAYIAISSVISAATNIPVDRLFRKINNIRQATDENVRTFERVALLLGWNGWNFGLPYWGRESTIKKEEAELERLKKRFTAQVKYAKSNGFTKRVPFTGKNSWSNGIPKGLKEGVDYIAIERYDGIIQYYKKP